MSGSVQIGQRQADLTGFLRIGEDNTVALNWRDADLNPAAWPSTPVLSFATSYRPDAIAAVTPATVMSDGDTVAVWTVTAAEIERLRGRSGCWARLQLDGVTIASGSVKLLSSWADQPMSPRLSVNFARIVVGPRGPAGESGSGYAITEIDGELHFEEV